MTKGTYQVFEVIKETEDGTYESTTFYKRVEAEAYAKTLMPKKPKQIRHHFVIRVNHWLKLGDYRAQLQMVQTYDTRNPLHTRRKELAWSPDFKVENFNKAYLSDQSTRLEWRPTWV